MKLYLLIFLAILFWGIWGFTGKLATNHNSPAVVTLATNLLFALFSLTLIFSIRNQTTPIIWSSPAILWIVLTAVFGVAATIIFYMALSESPSSKVVALTATYPIITVILATIFLGERLSGIQILGILLSASGVYLLMAK